MVFQLLNIIFELLNIRNLFNCRLICHESLQIITFIFSHIRFLPDSWNSYMNMYGIRKLLCNVHDYNK